MNEFFRDKTVKYHVSVPSFRILALLLSIELIQANNTKYN